jgi:hypothetical protein
MSKKRKPIGPRDPLLDRIPGGGDYRPYCRIAGVTGVSAHTKQLRESLLARDGNACWICGDEIPEGSITIDHIHPVSLGGETYLWNLKLAHHRCNGFRSSKVHLTPEELCAQMAERSARMVNKDRHYYICSLYKALAERYPTSRQVNAVFRQMYGNQIACAPAERAA